MSDQPGRPDESDDEGRDDNQQNPFAGTPWEQLFQGMGGAQSGGQAMDMNQFLQQLQAAFGQLGLGGTPGAAGAQPGGFGLFGRPGGGTQGSGDGPVNWPMVTDVARKTVAAAGPDPSPSQREQTDIADAVRLAQTWLRDATALPDADARPAAWSRAHWVEATMPVWRRLVEPVATSMADAMAGTLDVSEGPEAQMLAGMNQMLRPMLRSSGASILGLQAGQSIGKLATEVLSGTDNGLPLTDGTMVAMLPAAVRRFGEGLEQSETDVRMYLALREVARHQLFASAGWLRSQILTLVEAYAKAIRIDTSALEEAMGDPSMLGMDPQALQQLSSKLEGALFSPSRTPEQEETLQQLETKLALIEGWVDDVVGEVANRWLADADALAETVRRRRAAGGPAEATLAELVGLELRPRRTRDAANLWAALRKARGVEARDKVWSHPDLMPSAVDLDDPIGYAERAGRPVDQDGAGEDDIDAELRRLLAGEDDRAGGEADKGDTTDDRDTGGDGDDPRP